MLTCWKKTIWDSSRPKKERCLKKAFVSASVAALVMMYHLMGFLQTHISFLAMVHVNAKCSGHQLTHQISAPAGKVLYVPFLVIEQSGQCCSVSCMGKSECACCQDLCRAMAVPWQHKRVWSSRLHIL